MKKSKYSKEEVEDKIHDICIDQIEEEYRVFWRSDDSGTHVCVYFEGKIPRLAEKLLPNNFMDARLILICVPIGYLREFYPLR